MTAEVVYDSDDVLPPDLRNVLREAAAAAWVCQLCAGETRVTVDGTEHRAHSPSCPLRFSDGTRPIRWPTPGLMPEPPDQGSEDADAPKRRTRADRETAILEAQRMRAKGDSLRVIADRFAISLATACQWSRGHSSGKR